MRLITQDKLYRAYPVLDQFDDETCLNYMRRAWKLKSTPFGALMVLLIVTAAILVCVGLSWLGIQVWPSLDSKYDLSKNDTVVIWVIIVWVSGGIGIPFITGLIARDLWLKRCFKELLDSVRCSRCDYSLVGLELLEEADSPSVRCPECGIKLRLKALGLTEEDIDPTRIGEAV